MWKDEKKISPALEIPYFPWHAKNEQSYTLTSKWRYDRFEFNFEELDNDLKIMSEFIEPFLVALSQFLPEEERKKLEPAAVSVPGHGSRGIVLSSKKSGYPG